jgi:Limiting CO2-inducible proteins B/C beta carbonyic anhydrases
MQATSMMMKKPMVALRCLALATSSYAFTAAPRIANVRALTSSTALAGSVVSSTILDKLRVLLDEETSPKMNPEFDAMLQARFPGAINNNDLEKKVVQILSERGYDTTNTLLATSLCCDELARRLEDDFVKIYGNNFNLGGLSGFPFAGNTG